VNVVVESRKTRKTLGCTDDAWTSAALPGLASDPLTETETVRPETVALIRGNAWVVPPPPDGFVGFPSSPPPPHAGNSALTATSDAA
jgi:hypothetical protein